MEEEIRDLIKEWEADAIDCKRKGNNNSGSYEFWVEYVISVYEEHIAQLKSAIGYDESVEDNEPFDIRKEIAKLQAMIVSGAGANDALTGKYEYKSGEWIKK